MNAARKDVLAWTQKRFWGVVGFLFVFQVGLILAFSDRSHSRPSNPLPPLEFRALGANVSEDQLLRQFFVGDPAVFPLPNPRGFSGRGWMDQKPLTYQAGIQLESPILLTLTKLSDVPTTVSRFVSSFVSGLGTNLPVAPSSARPSFSGLVEQQTPMEEPFPVFLTPTAAPTQSTFRLQGDLAKRLLSKPALGTWPSAELLKSSIVQIGVDPQGEVIAARLDTSCGLADADNEAVTKARALRFHSAARGETEWGKAIFQWQTIAPTNVSPSK